MTIEEIIESLEGQVQDKDRLSGGDPDSIFTRDADVLMEAVRFLRLTVVDGKMTNEEAILFLQRAARHARNLEVRSLYQICEQALSAQSEKGCNFCGETSRSWESGGAHDFRIKGNGLFYYDQQFGWEGITIQYCPMCGRRLDGTTYAQIEVEKNKPLTLDELRNMDGKLVWIERIGGRTPYDSAVAFVHTKNELCRTADGCNAFFELYGTSWLAYRYKPMEGTT